jgi:hypothetical protein
MPIIVVQRYPIRSFIFSLLEELSKAGFQALTVSLTNYMQQLIYYLMVDVSVAEVVAFVHVL